MRRSLSWSQATVSETTVAAATRPRASSASCALNVRIRTRLTAEKIPASSEPTTLLNTIMLTWLMFITRVARSPAVNLRKKAGGSERRRSQMAAWSSLSTRVCTRTVTTPRVKAKTPMTTATTRSRTAICQSADVSPDGTM